MRIVGMLLTIGFALSSLAAVTGWRTDGTGLYPKAAPQTAWGPTTNVAWAAELPAWSNATPVVVGDRIFVTAEPSTLLCFDRTGALLWQRANTYEDLLTTEQKATLADERAKIAPLDQKEAELQRTKGGLQGDLRQAQKDAKDKPDDAELKDKITKLQADIAALDTQLTDVRQQKRQYPLAEQYRMPGTHPTNGYTSDTPVSDGQNVWVAFGTGVVACYALDGTRRWARLVEKPQHVWGQSCSPVLVGDTLIIQLIQAFALDARTGDERWHRPLGHNWGTPQPTQIGALSVVVADNGDVLNVADGKTLGSTKMALGYGSYLVIGDIIYGATSPNAAAFQLSLDANGALLVTKLWQTPVMATPPGDNRYYASPLVYNGLMYTVNHAGILSVFDAVTGARQYEQELKLGGTCYPSPSLCGNALIFGSDSGRAVIVAPGAAYQELARAAVEPFRASPVCDGRRMYLRTCVGSKSKLYCFEAPAQ